MEDGCIFYSMKIFYKKDVPFDCTMQGWIDEHSEMDELITSIDKEYKGPQVRAFKLSGMSHQNLRESVSQAFEKFGWYGFAHLQKCSELERSKVYGGLGLVYNPGYAYNIEPHAQVLGYPRQGFPDFLFSGEIGEKLYRKLILCGQDKEFFYKVCSTGWGGVRNWLEKNKYLSLVELKQIENRVNGRGLNYLEHQTKQVRDTYTDSYSFNEPCDVARFGEIGKICRQFRRSLIRSRIAELKGQFPELGNSSFALHRDASYFYEMRLIICVSTDSNKYRMYIENYGEFIFEEGLVYAWDTDTPHCFYAVDNPTNSRINLVFAFSPWFDFDPVNQAWEPNLYCGATHPMEMLSSGGLIDGLEEVPVKRTNGILPKGMK